MRNIHHLISYSFLFVGLILTLGGWQVKPVNALVNCCPSIAQSGGTGCQNLAYCSDSDDSIRECCYPAQCRYDNTSVSLSYCGSETNVCCQSGTCSSVCGTIPMWTWCRITDCLASADPLALLCRYTYSYQTTACNAVDSCYPGSSPYLYAALCRTDGCAVGGQYKTCCNGDGTVAACIGGEYSGGCPGGSTPVVNCVGASCCTGGPTNTPTATLAPGEPTPTPGGATNTPAPVQCSAPNSCVVLGSCAESQKRSGECSSGLECCYVLPDACTGNCRKSNPFDPDNLWSGNFGQCSDFPLAGHYQYWPGGDSVAAGTIGNVECTNYGIGLNSACNSNSFDCYNICCGPLWATATNTPTPTATPTEVPDNPPTCDSMSVAPTCLSSVGASVTLSADFTDDIDLASYVFACYAGADFVSVGSGSLSGSSATGSFSGALPAGCQTWLTNTGSSKLGNGNPGLAAGATAVGGANTWDAGASGNCRSDVYYLANPGGLTPHGL